MTCQENKCNIISLSPKNKRKFKKAAHSNTPVNRRGNNGQKLSVLVSLEADHSLTEAFGNVHFKTDYVILIKIASS